MAAVATKNKSLLFELISIGSSGFFLDGTQGTPEAQELTTTSTTWIPEQGYTWFTDKETGQDVMKEIRYIAGQNIIFKDEQEKLGIKPNPKNDKIIFIKGYLRAEHEGVDRNLVNYLKAVFYNEGAKNRPENAFPMFREVDQNKVPQILIADDDDLERAIHITNGLKIKIGKEGKYEYKEERIENLARLFKIQAETAGQQLALLVNHAKLTPRLFVEKVENFDQIYETEVNQGLDLEVIAFKGSGAIFKDTGETITDFGSGSISKDKKFGLLVDFFKSPEGERHRESLLILTDAKKAQSFK